MSNFRVTVKNGQTAEFDNHDYNEVQTHGKKNKKSNERKLIGVIKGSLMIVVIAHKMRMTEQYLKMMNQYYNKQRSITPISLSQAKN